MQEIKMGENSFFCCREQRAPRQELKVSHGVWLQIYRFKLILPHEHFFMKAHIVGKQLRIGH